MASLWLLHGYVGAGAVIVPKLRRGMAWMVSGIEFPAFLGNCW